MKIQKLPSHNTFQILADITWYCRIFPRFRLLRKMLFIICIQLIFGITAKCSAPLIIQATSNSNNNVLIQILRITNFSQSESGWYSVSCEPFKASDQQGSAAYLESIQAKCCDSSCVSQFQWIQKSPNIRQLRNMQRGLWMHSYR